MTGLAACLLVVFAAAKAILLEGRDLPASAWAPFVYVWQDVAVALGCAVCERIVRKGWAARLAYGALVLLVAINVPVERVLSSPLTAPMLRAARVALSDSLRHYVTPANIAAMAFIVLLGAALPVVAARVPRLAARTQLASLALAVLVVGMGVLGAPRVATAGLERNPLVALVETSLPRVRGTAANDDWRASPFAAPGAADDLSPLRGAARGRNVLLVVLESTAARYLRSYGAAEDPTPNLTSLATRSLVFENVYAAYPESIKGFVAILASRYPGFDVAAERHATVISPSLATVLRDAGYQTALFHSGRFMYLGMDAVLARSGFTEMEDAGDIGGNRHSSFGIDELSTVRRVLAWIDSCRGASPFFAAYLPVAGHHPYAHAEGGPFPDSEEIGRYRNALYEGDHALGVLLDGLHSRGLDRSTLVVVLADHGEAFGQHEGNFAHTLALYDENVRVPLVVSMPGVTAAARRVPGIASLVDVAPTVLDLLGRTRTAAFEGESLLGARSEMALFFTDYSLGLLGLRDGCTKFIHELESGRSRMFDLCRDPDERADIAAGSPDRAAFYRERLLSWSAAEVARIGR